MTDQVNNSIQKRTILLYTYIVMIKWLQVPDFIFFVTP